MFYGGPRAAPQSTMRHLRRGIMPGTPVCHRKVWIKAFTFILLFLKGFWTGFQRKQYVCVCEHAYVCVSVCVFPHVFICSVPSAVPEIDMTRAPCCNSSTCFFNNSAADCISVHHYRQMRRECCSLLFYIVHDIV